MRTPSRSFCRSSTDRRCTSPAPVSNQGRFASQLDAVVLLSPPAEVLLNRIESRTTNRYGKRRAKGSSSFGIWSRSNHGYARRVLMRSTPHDLSPKCSRDWSRSASKTRPEANVVAPAMTDLRQRRRCRVQPRADVALLATSRYVATRGLRLHSYSQAHPRRARLRDRVCPVGEALVARIGADIVAPLHQLRQRRRVRRRGRLRWQAGASKVRSLIAWRVAFRCSSPCRRKCSDRLGSAGRRSSPRLARFRGLL
jgi:hypothetical protein